MKIQKNYYFGKYQSQETESCIFLNSFIRALMRQSLGDFDFSILHTYPRYLQKVALNANNEVAVLQEGRQDKGRSSCEKENFLSSVSRSRRGKQPTSDELSMRVKRRRVLETYNAATEIHGGIRESNEAAATGLVETLDIKFSKKLVSSLVYLPTLTP